MNSNKDLFGDSSSDDDHDDNKANVAMDVDENKQETNVPKESAPKKTTSLFDSDDDDDEGDEEFDDKGAIVGLQASANATTGNSNAASNNAPIRATDGDEDDDDDDGSHQEVTKVDSNVPQVDQRTLLVQEYTRPDVSHISTHMSKLPNLVGIQTAAFDTETYSRNLEEEEFGPAVDHLIRWRYRKDAHGNLVRDAQDRLIRESNTRIVQWEDGSYTLHVGSEAFEIDVHNTASSAGVKGFPGLNGYLFLSHKATMETTEGSRTEETPAGTVLESVASIASRLMIRPSSLQSEAHKSLTVAVRQKTIKKARIAEFVTQEDPEKAKQERIRVKADLDKVSGRKRPSSGGNRGNRPRMSRDYFEDDEEDGDYDTFRIKATKRRVMDAEELEEYGEEDDEEADTTFNRRSGRNGDSGKRKDKDSDDEIMVADDSDDEEDEFEMAQKKTKKPAHRAVLDDDDSD
jgi:RNA polymerase-associated protein LEO1